MTRHCCAALAVVLGCWLSPASAASVLFLSPGPASDGYWSAYARFMQAAATRLGMDLTVRYSNRDTRELIELARDALQGPFRPDYLVFSNELNVAPEILRLSQGSDVTLFAVNNTLTDDQVNILGDLPRRYPNFIGSLIGNDEEGGYLTAKRLISLYATSKPDQSIEMLAFSGTNSTPVSLKREQGMLRALAEHPEVRLRQIVLGGWRRDRALEQARVLLKRYPDIGLIWASNDQMAFGAMDAVREMGREPGKDVLFSTINWAPHSLNALQNGQISALAGGHFMLGGLAMVLLNDYDATDPATRKAIGSQQARVMKLVGISDLKQIRSNSKRDDYGVDFRTLSLKGQPASTDYSFLSRPLPH
ncbi:ABC transporter substrate-binding protein [Pseudomonas caspiana]|uniref:Sugar ABC transporter substrate-binding protein n=1 Tax=Pseudomonas caspiana TaxID=1451454 RepID=A0A1Y3P220_9PSED|nr:ABC transporter substrate-binding protein [Pseudomonas caspiana]OUM72571.1 sugar ABC transporter substrate-binding protein [Pseudomonas caspiana]